MKLYRINALLLKYYYITINRIDRIFDIIYWPFVSLLLWGFTSTFIDKAANLNLISVMIGGFMLWILVWRATQDMAVFVLEDFWSDNLYHLFSSPVRLSEHVISIVLLGFLRAFLTFGVMVVIGILVYSFNIFTLNPGFLAIAMFLLSIFGWALGLLVIALIIKWGQRIQVLAWSIVWLVQPFSCIFYPLESLPRWAQYVAKVMPTTYIFENLRNVVYHNTIDYRGMVYAFIISVVMVVLMVFFLKWSFESSRKSGLLAKSG